MMKIQSIEHGQVHVWTLDLDKSSLNNNCGESLLSGDEIMRADRFRLSLHREMFVRRHVYLRLLLASYLEVDAGNIRFAYGIYGKPRIVGTTEFHFSLSHAENMMMVAFTMHGKVGLDFVSQSHQIDPEGIPGLIFSAGENEAYAALSALERRAAFFRIWARKEAFIKALGKSIALHSKSFSVSVLPGKLSGQIFDYGPEKISLCDIDAPKGFFAALAAEGTDWTVSAFSEQNIETGIC
ncbi:MAG: 4'-phosphopantetheinyl transferase superfamily protein [Chlorobiaceae bacterium]|nr:4'-phosphopantetheinyl transferase superfamily protein [Chlorobiaceae bacterium]NTW11649.1 4'-phosphopantetheinyl transferase superfamily protein [Chlorobiaceae bacterium]